MLHKSTTRFFSDSICLLDVLEKNLENIVLLKLSCAMWSLCLLGTLMFAYGKKSLFFKFHLDPKLSSSLCVVFLEWCQWLKKCFWQALYSSSLEKSIHWALSNNKPTKLCQLIFRWFWSKCNRLAVLLEECSHMENEFMHLKCDSRFTDCL